MITNRFPTSKTFTLLIVFLFGLFSNAQENQGQIKISPKWKIGDSKKVHVDHTTRVTFDDSLVKNLQSRYDVRIKLTDIKADYIISWSCNNDNELLQHQNSISNPDQKESEIIEALKSAEEKVLHVNLILKMDKTTGEIKEWSNGRELLKNAEFQQKKKIKEWCNSRQVSDAKRIDMELEFSKRLNASYPIWRDLLLQKANFFFESYNQNFLMNQTLVEDILTRDILDLNDDETKFPGKMTKEATEVNDRLILDKKIEYQKDFLIAYLKKIGNSFTTLTNNDILVFEKEQSIFDLKSTWLINYSKKLYFEVKGMKTTATTTVTFL